MKLSDEQIKLAKWFSIVLGFFFIIGSKSPKK